jgi:hypothetical protein
LLPILLELKARKILFLSLCSEEGGEILVGSWDMEDTEGGLTEVILIELTGIEFSDPVLVVEGVGVAVVLLLDGLRVCC